MQTSSGASRVSKDGSINKVGGLRDSGLVTHTHTDTHAWSRVVTRGGLWRPSIKIISKPQPLIYEREKKEKTRQIWEAVVKFSGCGRRGPCDRQQTTQRGHRPFSFMLQTSLMHSAAHLKGYTQTRLDIDEFFRPRSPIRVDHPVFRENFPIPPSRGVRIGFSCCHRWTSVTDFIIPVTVPFVDSFSKTPYVPNQWETKQTPLGLDPSKLSINY